MVLELWVYVYLSLGCLLADTFVVADSPTFLWAGSDIFGEVVANDIAYSRKRDTMSE